MPALCRYFANVLTDFSRTSKTNMIYIPVSKKVASITMTMHQINDTMRQTSFAGASSAGRSWTP